MDSLTPQPIPPAPSRRERPRFSAGYFFLAALLAGAGLLALTGKAEAFARYLYSPYSVSLLAVAAGMYLLQKSSDRSRIYRLELRELRRRRLQDMQSDRRMERDLEQAQALLGTAAPSDEDLAAARKTIEETIARLRARG